MTMKKLIFILIVLLSSNKINSQINNLDDLLEISALNIEQLVGELQYTWHLLAPEQDTSEKGFVREQYGFLYNRNGKKQALKRIGKMNLNTGQTFRLTNFISDDKELLNRIVKNLPYSGYELKGTLNSNSTYEDGNNVITIQKESDENFKLPYGCYSVNVVLSDRKQQHFYGQTMKNKEEARVKDEIAETLSVRKQENKNTNYTTKTDDLNDTLTFSDKMLDPYKVNSGKGIISFKTNLSLLDAKKVLEEGYNFDISIYKQKLGGSSKFENCIVVTAERKSNYTFVKYSWECD